MPYSASMKSPKKGTMKGTMKNPMKNPIRSWCAGVLAVLLSPLLSPLPAHAEFPDRTVKIVVPFDAGGSIDTVAARWRSASTTNGTSR